MNCIVDGCHRPAEKERKYCPGHRKREKKGMPLGELREWQRNRDPGAYLQAKAIEFADADSEDKRRHLLAWKRLMYAALAYARKRQKVPKTPKTPG